MIFFNLELQQTKEIVKIKKTSLYWLSITKIIMSNPLTVPIKNLSYNLVFTKSTQPSKPA